ncbi:related to salicylate 1-monooxygenase [Pseudozyma flocculosa]|uniref:Related to salicylate 1-monooxygenase n=1 Tax=Pseudozyma flocculosa TaxID=84751 RepID=A0A5C3F1G1_9BASI|nr:related to salicylate 1-monooxygenase [Pseudozyma flocculosa]SPO42286.1 related to salicylate 1-monooxygenase [Pseudozyma flocculosa]
MATSQQKSFHIVIVGAGIGGLAAAVALKAPGRRITLLEASRLNREVGANISLQPNAVKIAKRFLGLDSYLFGPDSIGRGVPDKAFLLYGTDDKLHMKIPLATDQYGEDRVCFHRVDLHSALKQAAVDGGAEIRTASRVRSVDCQTGEVTLESGEAVQADLVIGADGIRSVVRSAVLGRDEDAQSTGLSAYRTLIPTAELQHITGLPEGVRLGDDQTLMVVGRDCRMVMGPSRSSTVLGVVGLVPDSHAPQQDDGSWNTSASIEGFTKSFADFPAWVRAIIAKSVDLSIWQLRDTEPLERWHRQRATLIGDAAHAMLPTQGQGASQSFEDAEALQHLLRGVDASTTAEELDDRLAQLFAARHERASLIQAYSRQQARPGAQAGKVTLNPREFMDYNCQYDGVESWLRKKAEERRLHEDKTLLDTEGEQAASDKAAAAVLA